MDIHFNLFTLVAISCEKALLGCYFFVGRPDINVDPIPDTEIIIEGMIKISPNGPYFLCIAFGRLVVRNLVLVFTARSRRHLS